LSNAPFLIFLNDDTTLAPDYVKGLREALSKDENSIYQSLIFHEYAQRVLRGNPCDIYGAAGVGFYRNCGVGEFYASGASFAISRKLFDLLGGFDEKLFLYHEDVDLCWRARLMGYGVSVVESAICHHAGGGSSGTLPHATKFHLTQRNRIRALLKNYSTRRMLTRVPIACSLILAGGIFLALRARNVLYFISVSKAFAWNLSALQNTLVERHRIQHERVAEDPEIQRVMNRHSMDICVLKQYLRDAWQKTGDADVALNPVVPHQ
jgi:GT2 family glycosyltransferase